MKGSPMQRNFGIGNSPMKDKKKARTLTSEIKDKPKMGRRVEAFVTQKGEGRVKESKGKLAKGFKESKTKLPTKTNKNQSKINKLVKTRNNLKDKGATLKGKNAISVRLRSIQNQINKLSGSDVKRKVVTGE